MVPLPPPTVRTRNWLDLPPELTALILQRVGVVDVLISARKVCKTWRHICSDPSMWRVIHVKALDELLNVYEHLDEIIRQAVDLSCGQLIELALDYFGDDDLLLYVSDRSSQLRRLRLVSCCITDKGLSEMVRKLPLLEELHLYCVDISEEAIEVAGRNCPQLKSFTLNNHDFECPHIGCDEDAQAIAHNMPGLRHLQLLGNNITIGGLMAIIENCPHLESLDIRESHFVNLKPDTVKRLSQQIKDLRLPYDSTEDYEFEEEILFINPFGTYYSSYGLSDTDSVSDDYDSYDDDYQSESSGGSDIDSDIVFDDHDPDLYDYVVGRISLQHEIGGCWIYGAKYGYFAMNTKNTGGDWCLFMADLVDR